MENEKRGFVVYFDSAPAMDTLPPEQRGWVFSALCCYGERVWRDLTVSIDEVLELYPQLSQSARALCMMMASSVLRDTRKWLQQRESRTLARQQRKLTGEMPARRQRLQAVTPQGREDMERLRRMAEHDFQKE